MEKKSVIFGFILAIVLFGLIALASAEDWNLNNPVVVQNQNVTGKQNLTFLPENAIVIIGAGGNVTSDVANLTYYAANQTLVVKLIKVQNISDSDNTAYYVDPANTGTSGVFASKVGIGTTSPATKMDINSGSAVGTTSLLTLSGLDSVSAYSEYIQIAMGISDNTAGAEQGNLLLKTMQSGTLRDVITYNSVAVNALQFLVNNTAAVTILNSGNVGIGTTTSPSGGGTPVFIMAQAGSAPTGFGSNTAGIVVLDNAGTAAIYVCNEAGTCGIQTPHPDDFLNNFSSDYFFPWVHQSTNPYLGRKITVDMEGAFRAIENLSGKQFIYTENMNKLSWADLENWRESEENNKSRDAAVQAWLRNASELEVLPSLAFEMVWDNKTVTTGRIVGNTTEYSFDENGTVMGSLVPVFETKTISRQKKQLKDGIQFNKAIGKFYRKPTRAEAEVAVGESYPHYIKQAPPKWMADRGAN